ncbi:protein ligase ARIH1 [Seminavis robusta]|uniref:Protein ligase ARIH1 n=1 Tax=Seminavis robusta TaxID=568900 RepID=A0A9N8HML9_9STRA|nr:protein ligase ARIH1 [Seminavis robusta]|eukprot:Sro910_g219150.1 protein ligase ARIH1 (579) ;mRNA; f:31597-33415
MSLLEAYQFASKSFEADNKRCDDDEGNDDDQSLHVSYENNELKYTFEKARKLNPKNLKRTGLEDSDDDISTSSDSSCTSSNDGAVVTFLEATGVYQPDEDCNPISDPEVMENWLELCHDKASGILCVNPSAVQACAKAFWESEEGANMPTVELTATRKRSRGDNESNALVRSGILRAYFDGRRSHRIAPTGIEEHGVCLSCKRDGIPRADRLSLECSHFYCRDCWTVYLGDIAQAALGRGGLPPPVIMKCPSSKCCIFVARIHVSKFVPSLLSGFDGLAQETILQRYKTQMRRCPDVNCGHIALRCGEKLLIQPTGKDPEMDPATSVRCEHCETRFCFVCGDDAHDNFVCTNTTSKQPSTAGKVANATEGQAKKRKLEDGKSSTAPVSAGGNTLTRDCLSSIVSDASDAHSRAKGKDPRFDLDFVIKTIHGTCPELSEELEEQREELQVLSGYFKRFVLHGQRQQLATTPIDAAKSAFLSTSDEESDNFVRGRKSLVASNRMLKYSSVLLHEKRDDNLAHDATLGLFLEHLAQLGQATEDLCSLIEKSSYRSDSRKKVLNKIERVDSCMMKISSLGLE